MPGALGDLLRENTKEGVLYEKHPDGSLTCFSCGHRCLIKEGRAGICKVRFNDGGILKVPSGYVGALQVDPIEKKPFFHAFPGSNALSFGMLGCDFHCGYCFPPQTRVATDRGMIHLGELARQGRRPVRAISHTGARRSVVQVFSRTYEGKLLRLSALGETSVECTPEHPFLTSKRSARLSLQAPVFKEAKDIVPREDCLVIPRSVKSGGHSRGFGVWRDDRYAYVPVTHVQAYDYSGSVFNLEVGEDHTYLANSFAVHNCQNWFTSQALRDPNSTTESMPTSPAQLCDLGRRYHAPVLASTYNEPLITSEWAVEIFELSKKQGFVNAYISNGNGTDEVLDYIRPYVDLYKVDLKSFRDKNYRALGGQLDVVLKTIEGLKRRGFWLEIVTLVIPGFNDSEEELRDTAQFLAGVSRDIPWHVTAFHKDYKMQDPDNTTPAHLARACEIGAQAGLRYIYAGNLPGMVGRWENTCCPSCGAVLIERHGYQILDDKLSGRGKCPGCGTAIPGVWGGGVWNPQG